MAHNSVHGRYFAGKQVKCEFVSLTRWKVAICGEYMKSRLKTCSRGSACNFLHCFSNPGGDYEWADCDKPPPRYWEKKMTSLFGYSDDSWHDQQIEQPSPKDQQRSSKIFTSDRDSDHYKRRRSIETNQHDGGSGRSRHDRHHEQKKDDKSYEYETEFKNNHHGSSENRSRHNRIDYYDRSRSRTHGGSSSDEDLCTERRHAYKKRRSRHHRENILESSNDDGESSETELQKHKERKTDSARRSRRHDDEVDHRESTYIKKEKRRYRKSTSLHRNNRSRSQDSGYLSDRSDRWDPEGSPNDTISDDGKTKSGSLEQESKNQENRMREKRKRI